MKVLIIVCSLVLNLNSIWAQELATKRPLNQNWSYTKLFVSTNNSSVLKTKMFKRYIWIGDRPVQIAETTYTYLKNPQEKMDLNSLSESITKSLQLKNLKIKTIQNGIEINGNWLKINRFVKMELIKKGSDFVFISSFARAGLVNGLLPELNELHLLLRSYSENKNIKTSFFKYFIPEVVAGEFDPLAVTKFMEGTNISSIPGSVIKTDSKVHLDVSGKVDTNVTIGTSSGIDKLVGDTNSKIGTATNVLDKNWGDTNSKIGDATNVLDKNWGDTNSKIGDATTVMDKQGTEANKNWSKTNEVINSNWAESNKIAAKMMDPKHMAKLAYYTAAGAALGAVSMNLAVAGVSAGISFLYELFTGEKKKKLEWEDFQKAISSWDDQLNDLVKLEKIVDEFIGAFEFFSDKEIDNNYVKNLEMVMRDMRFDRDLLLEKYKNTNIAIECRRVFYNAADELEQKLKEYEKITQFTSSHNITGNKSENYFCQQLAELQRKLLSAETQMQDLRLAILTAENQFYDKSTSKKEHRVDQVEDINDKIGKTIKNRQEYNAASTENLKINFEIERDEWVSACVDAKNDDGKKIKAEIDNRFTHFFKAKGMCKTAFDSTHSLKEREDNAKKLFETENELRADLKIRPNNDIDVKLTDAQLNWLTRIHMDAYCYQYAHTEPEKIPTKCKDFPELLYSMNLSKGYDKAKKAYKDKCEDRYLNGIKKLVKN